MKPKTTNEQKPTNKKIKTKARKKERRKIERRVSVHKVTAGLDPDSNLKGIQDHK